MSHTISLCIIAHNESKNLPRCIASVREYVDEVIVVDTGSTDDTVAVAQALGCRVEMFSRHNHPECFAFDDESTGAPGPYTYQWFLADFAAARNRSFELATSDYVFWMDADDTLAFARKLRTAVAKMATKGVDALDMLYEYWYDAYGRPSCTHRRTRIIKRTASPTWSGKVHELVTTPSLAVARDNTMIVQHHHETRTFRIAHRNYKILLRMLKEEEKRGLVSSRTLYYLGQETRFMDPAKSRSYYARYCRYSFSGEELALACYFVGKSYEDEALQAQGKDKELFLKRIEESARYYGRGTVARVEIGENWFGLARLAYWQNRWEDCCFYMERGLSFNGAMRQLPANPLDCTLYPHDFYANALIHCGRVQDALKSCEAGLLVDPQDKYLLTNADVCRRYLGDIKQTPGPLMKDIPDFVFWAGASWERWTPATPDSKGLGGSEIALVAMAKGLRAQGYRVVVYNDCGTAEGVYDGVEYRNYMNCFILPACKVFISSRQPGIIDQPLEAKAKWLWMHDTACGFAPKTEELMGRFDGIFCLSQWAREHLLEAYPSLDPNKVIVTRNGIDLGRFTERPEKECRAMYSSMPNRGLELLLEKLWPRVTKEVPEATLHLYYGFETLEKLVSKIYINKIDDLIRKTPSVIWHGRVGQKELADAWLRSMVWTYPTSWEETSCITAMEAQAAGCVPVTTPVGALPETVGDGGIMIYGGTDQEYGDLYTDEKYQDLWVDEVVKLFISKGYRDAVADRGQHHAKELGWDGVVKQWVGIFSGMI